MELQHGNRTPSGASDGFAARVLAFGGGKGGVGKSFLAAATALLLARRGARVLVADLDLGGANLHAWLGIPPLAEHDLGEMLRGGAELEKLVIEGPEGLAVLHGATRNLGAPNLRYQTKRKLVNHLRRLPYEWVVLDIGAGSSYNTLDLFLLGNRGILVVNPEKTSVENTYRFIRAAALRLVRRHTRHRGVVKELGAFEQGYKSLRSIRRLIELVGERDPEARRLIESDLRAHRFSLVLNQVYESEELQVALSMRELLARHLGVQLSFLGPVRHDENVVRALRRAAAPVQEILQHEGVRTDLHGVVDRILRDTEYVAPGG